MREPDAFMSNGPTSWTYPNNDEEPGLFVIVVIVVVMSDWERKIKKWE